jgi:hypothetical protein
MAYTITTTSGAALATVADGTVNTTSTSLTLIGKNYAGYGVFLNENYIKLLENFSFSVAPNAPLTGQLWYDTTNSVLKVYNGDNWKPISSSASGTTEPTSRVLGDLWWDTANGQLRVFSGSAWVVVGPSFTTAAGTSGALVQTILDSGSASHVVVMFYISNTVVAILSKDATFTPQTSIAGFSTVRPGFNLISASTIAGAQFTGDVSNALTLQGVTASQFLRSDQNASTAFSITAGGGLTVGSDLTVNTTSGTEVAVRNSTLNKDINFYVNSAGTDRRAIRTVGANASVFLGATASSQVQTSGPAIINGALTASSTLAVTGTSTFSSAITASSTLNVTGVTTISNSLLPGANATINIGSVSSRFANIHATNFIGTAITAQYADLAERFEADAVYTPGTVVELGGLKEVTAAVEELSEAVFGVISTAAGFLMNGGAGTNETHPPIAVNGRVPVRVIGKCRKGDRLVSAGNGLARSADRSELTAFNVLGRALENKTTDGEGLVEAIVKLNS